MPGAPDTGWTGRIGGSDEATLVALMRGHRPVDPTMIVDNGDDAAVLGPSAATVVTTDMLVEGTHFRRDLTSPAHIGRRAVAQNVADVLAMGADCERLLVAVAFPRDMAVGEAAELSRGVHEEAVRAGARVVGGDVTTGPVLVLTVTAIGSLEPGRRPVRLDGGRPGDVLALTGRPGRSAAGLDLLLAGRDEGPLQEEHRVPPVPYGLGVAAAGSGARSLTDVSDGLLRDLATLACASGCAADVRTVDLGVDTDLVAAAEALGSADVDEVVRAWMLDGGEDHGLLAAFPPGAELPTGFRSIGHLVDARPGEAGRIVVDGVVTRPGGWDSAGGPVTTS